jgi:DNA-binding LytR/AlgR family response regulator
MKIKIVSNSKDKEKIKEKIKSEELIESVDDYELLIIDPAFIKQELLGKTKNDEYILVKPEEIIYVESYGREIICHTTKGDLNINEKLYELEELFEKDGFIRVHKSYIINKHQIKTIKPTLNTKFILQMNNKDKIEVTRNYYYLFKSKIGM